MLRSKAIVIRATSERDELVREARRLYNLLDSLPHIPEADVDETIDEIAAAAREIDEIGRLAGSLDGAARPEERATVRRLRELAGDARRRRRALRGLRRRLLAERFDDAYDMYEERLAA